MYFKFKKLLNPPVARAAYSDRTAWLMAEMSNLAYIKFESNDGELSRLRNILEEANFLLVSIFNVGETQAFLAKRDKDKMVVLAFRGTEKEDVRDIISDIDIRFYKDKDGVKIHNGFFKAFQKIENSIYENIERLKEFSLYITGHSLGGALALIATRVFNSDNLAACYTFGSPKVGNEEFDDDIKAPIYRVVNAFDIVPFSPPTYLFNILLLLPWKWAKSLAKRFYGYTHHGDMRYLTFCDTSKDTKVIANYNEFFRMFEFWKHKKEGIKHHAIDAYCEKLGEYGLKRLNVK